MINQYVSRWVRSSRLLYLNCLHKRMFINVAISCISQQCSFKELPILYSSLEQQKQRKAILPFFPNLHLNSTRQFPKTRLFLMNYNNYRKEEMKNIDQFNANTPSNKTISLSLDPHTPSPHKIIQNIQISKTPRQQLTSHRSVDTQCTSESFDHSDQRSLSFVDEDVEYQGSHKQINSFDQIDLQPSTRSQKVISKEKSNYLAFLNTLTTHFKSTMKVDKYLRLLSSIIKTWRAYQPKTKLNSAYKEIILARRVIRWESKYDTIIEFLKEESFGMKSFKIMQLMGDLVDLVAFWLKTIHKGTKNQEKLIDRLEQVESDFYFAECIVWLGVYSYRYFATTNKTGKSEEEVKEIKKKLVENALKVIKYVMDILTSYNNSSLKKMFGEINHKLAGFLTFFSSSIGIFLLWK